MCKVKELKDCDRKIAVVTKDGRKITSSLITAEESGCLVPSRHNSEETYRKLISKNSIDEDSVCHWYVAVSKEKDTIYISDHAMDRMRKRLGWNRNASYRMTKKIYEEGKGIQDTKGALRTWLEEKAEGRWNCLKKKARGIEYRIYGNYVFLFAGDTLVTVYDMGSIEAHTQKRQKIHEGAGRSSMTRKQKWAD